MKKALSVILCVVLSISMLLTMTGCGSEQSKFVGKWRGEIDMTDYLNDQFAQDEEMSKYIKLKSFAFDMIFEFKDDGTYSQKVDEDSFDDAMDDLIDDLTVGMEKLFEEQAEALGFSVSEILELSGYSTVKEMVEESYSKETLGDLTAGMVNEGKFKVADGKLYLSEGKDYDVDEDEYYTYEIDGDKFVIQETHVSGEEDYEDLLPWTFEKF